MGFRRLLVRRGEALRLHRRLKQYSSFGVGAFLFVGFLLVCAYEGVSFRLKRPAEPIEAELQQLTFWGHRRLEASIVNVSATAIIPSCAKESESVYPDDPIIPKRGNPQRYSNATPVEKLGIIVHIVLVVYMLLGLNTVCDMYFCGALDMMVDRWNVKPDVAGATFMAAGGSAPELFTSLIGACITENDVGFATIVGSAVFNVLAVIGACGMCATEPIQLTWWPFFRDCSFYVCSLGLLAYFASGEALIDDCGDRVGGGSISLYEAIILFFVYVGYCTMMYFNEALEARIKGFLARASGRSAESSGSTSKVAPIGIEDTEPDREATPITDEGAPSLRENAVSDEAMPGPPEQQIKRADLQTPPVSPPSLQTSVVSPGASARTALPVPNANHSSTSPVVQPLGLNASDELQRADGYSINVPGHVIEEKKISSPSASPAVTPRTRFERLHPAKPKEDIVAYNSCSPTSDSPRDRASAVSACLNISGSDFGRSTSVPNESLMRRSLTVNLRDQKNNNGMAMGHRATTKDLGQTAQEKRQRHHIQHHIRVVHHKAHLKPEQNQRLRVSLTGHFGEDVARQTSRQTSSDTKRRPSQINSDSTRRPSNEIQAMRQVSHASEAPSQAYTEPLPDTSIEPVSKDSPFSSEDACYPSTKDGEGSGKVREGFRSSGSGEPAVESSGEGESVESGNSDDSDDIETLMQVPEALKERILWVLSLPIYAPLYFGIPKPTEKWFLATFIVALLWIGGFSLVLVYCVELFGEAILGGGNNVTVVMSVTLLAAGTSIPDLVSSMAVARAGEGDMAVSSSIGSNIFDILVGLPVPWMIKIALVDRDAASTVAVRSPYIGLFVILLLFMVFSVGLSIHLLKWQLDRRLGIVMFVLYVFFLAVVLPVEILGPAI